MLRPYIAQDDAGVRRDGFPEDPALSVPGALRLRARRRLEVVDEPLHDATFHKTQRTGGHALIVQGARRGATDAEGIVGEREPGVEHLLADLCAQWGNALEHRLPGE